MNFGTIYEEYLVYISKRQKKQSFDSLIYNFKTRILPYFENKDIFDIQANDIITWQNEILKFNFSNNYNRNLFYMLSGFWSYCCMQYKELDKNLLSSVGSFRKKFEENKSDFYTLAEFKKFIRYIDNNIYKQFFNLMFFTGTRPGEAMALKFSDLKDNYISITKTICSHGKREIDTPKNASSVRLIKIDKVLKKDLLSLKKYYERKYHNISYDYFIFGGIKPLSPTTINRYKQKACNRANLRQITLHQYRHSHATLLLHNGVIINEISRRLGHSRVSTTLNVYTHTNLVQEKKVINTLNSLRFNFFNSIPYNFKNLISILQRK